MHKYQNDKIRVTWDKGVCTHAAECVGSLPDVFNTKMTPWVNVNAAAAEEIERVVKLCPSGALTFAKLEPGQ